MPRIKHEDGRNPAFIDLTSPDRTSTRPVTKVEPDVGGEEPSASTTRPPAARYGLQPCHVPDANRRPSNAYIQSPHQHALGGLPAFNNQPPLPAQHQAGFQLSQTNSYAFLGAPVFHDPFAVPPQLVSPYSYGIPQPYVHQHALAGQRANPYTGYGASSQPTVAQGAKASSNTAWHQTTAAAGANNQQRYAQSGRTGSAAVEAPNNGVAPRRKSKRRASSRATALQNRSSLAETYDVGRLEFSSLEQAMEHVATRTALEHVQDDDHDDVFVERKAWILKLKNAFASPCKATPDKIPAGRETADANTYWANSQKKAYDELMSKLSMEETTASKQVELAVWKLLHKVLTVHREGYRECGYNIEQEMRCSERLRHIITGITEFARFRADALDESHHHAMAAAPRAYYVRKLTNLWINHGKKLDKQNRGAQGGRMARRSEAGTPAESVEDANTGSVAILGTHTPLEQRRHSRVGEAGVVLDGQIEAPRRSFMISRPGERYELTDEGSLMVIKAEEDA